MLKTNYDILTIDGLKKPLQEINKVCDALGINFFIVGAIARDIWFSTHKVTPSGTRDIDVGIYVPSVDEYNNLRKVLVEEYQYRQSESNAFCLFDPDGKQIDLFPFGEIENQGKVWIEGHGLNLIRLDGFTEAYNTGSVDVIIGDDVYKSCSIPSIVLLKMIAYDDKPDRRMKDIGDINSICSHYPHVESDLIWEEHNDLYGNEELEHFDVGMIVLGREIRKLIISNGDLFQRVLSIINNAISEESSFLSHMIENSEEETIDQKRRILKMILRGLID